MEGSGHQTGKDSLQPPFTLGLQEPDLRHDPVLSERHPLLTMQMEHQLLWAPHPSHSQSWSPVSPSLPHCATVNCQ